MLVPVAAVTAVLTLAGCSGSTGTDTAQEATTAPVAAAAATTAPTAATTTPPTAAADGVDGGEVLDRLAAAQEATREAGTARFSLTQEITGAGEDAGLATSAEGALDFVDGGLRMTITSSATSALPGDGQVELLVDGDTLYLRSPDTGEQWLSLPAGQQEIDDELDPTGLLDELTEAAVSAERAGTEEVRGVATTRYDVTIDLAQQLEGTTDADAREELQERIDALGGSVVPTSLWIDDDGRLRRQENEVTVAADGEDLVVAQTIEYYDFGAQVDLAPPDDVVSLPDLPLSTEP